MPLILLSLRVAVEVSIWGKGAMARKMKQHHDVLYLKDLKICHCAEANTNQFLFDSFCWAGYLQKLLPSLVFTKR